MTTKQDAYDKEVRRIAQILATTHELYVVDKYASKRCMDAARLMVAEMAKVYEASFFDSLDDALGIMKEENPHYVYYNELCIEKMQERGLIPSPTKDTEK